jgi:hypothetical protein
MKMSRSAALFIASSLALGCGEPLKDAQLIEEPRVLAVQVESASLMATPEVGEEARVRLLLAGPSGPLPVRVAYRVCEAVDSARGVPMCGARVFAAGETAVASPAPVFDFIVDDSVLPDTRLAVLGVACTNGEPTLSLDPSDWSCDGMDQPLRFSFDGTVGGKESHRNPDLDDLVVTISGEDATLTSVEDAPTCEEGVPQVEAGKEVSVSLVLGNRAREENEWLQLSHFSTGGKLERQYTIIEPEEQLRAVVKWKAHQEPMPIKHYLVVRDGRGGVGFAAWDVCSQ